MQAVVLLGFVTLAYAGYNFLMKLSGAAVPTSATTTILATISVQIAALLTSFAFLAQLGLRGDQQFALNLPTYFWAAIAGICIGAAEIGYLYLFAGVGQAKPMAANIAIPAVVSGTVLFALLFGVLLLNEPINFMQILGVTMIGGGVIVMFAFNSSAGH